MGVGTEMVMTPLEGKVPLSTTEIGGLIITLERIVKNLKTAMYLRERMLDSAYAGIYRVPESAAALVVEGLLVFAKLQAREALRFWDDKQP